jgi:hypothetical protein
LDTSVVYVTVVYVTVVYVTISVTISDCPAIGKVDDRINRSVANWLVLRGADASQADVTDFNNPAM